MEKRRQWGEAALALGLATGVTLALRPLLAPVNLAMVYLLAVVVVAARESRAVAVWMALGSVAAFDFLCVPPYYAFQVDDTEYVFTFVGMVAVAAVISSQTRRIRTQARESRAGEVRAEALYRLSSRLAQETKVFDIACAAAGLAEEALGAHVTIFLPEDGEISFRVRTAEHLRIPKAEETIAQWAFKHGRKAGRGVDPLLKATALYVPLRGARGTVGVMAVLGEGPEQEMLAELIAGQTALAMERTLSQSAEEAARVAMETEQMRSSLLSAVSHDLLTPLASIRGAASTVRQQGGKLSAETRDELLDSICEETERLGRLVRNLLDMTRFETGGVELRRAAIPLEDIVGTALHRLETALRGREVTVEISESLPLVYGDEVLLGQVFVNLLENAAKYTPAGTAIAITARQEGEMIQVDVRDHGPGIPEGQEARLFDKFFRTQAGDRRGAGLGLAIAKAVVECHGGTIVCFSHRDGGAVFRLQLPLLRVTMEESA